MHRNDADALAAEVRAWARRGLIPPESVAALEADIAARVGDGADRSIATPDEPSDEGASFGSVALFSLAGALGAAALFAFLAFTDASDPAAAITMGLVGLAAGAAAFAVRFAAPARGVWAEPLGVAAVVCLTVAPFVSDPVDLYTVWLALAAGLALPFAAGRYSPLPVLGVALVTLAGFRIIDLHFAESGFIFNQHNETGAQLWLGFQVLVTAGVVALGLVRPVRWWSGAAGASAIALVAPLMLFIGEVVQPRTEGVAELIVAIPEAILLGIGLAIGLRGLVIGSALVIAGDAIVFAFDVGGALIGTIALLAVAGAMIALAATLRKRLPAPRAR